MGTCGQAQPFVQAFPSTGKGLRRKWEDIIKMNLEDWRCGLDSSGSEQKTVMNSCENYQFLHK
jgi:hypothetical protein